MRNNINQKLVYRGFGEDFKHYVERITKYVNEDFNYAVVNIQYINENMAVIIY